MSSDETKQLIKIICRGIKFTVSLIEKWLNGEKV